MKTRKKRQRLSRKVREEKRDRLSELPDCVLIHMMEFMDTKHAVQTCVLSKRWKDLWKQLTTLVFDTFFFNKVVNFRKFVSQVLSKRDGSISLLNLKFTPRGFTQPYLLNRVMKYASCHNVQQLTIFVNLNNKPSFDFRPYIFSCDTLTFLKLSVSTQDPSMIVLPEYLYMPAIRTMQLESVTFTAYGRDYAEPFRYCPVLNTLILAGCSLHSDQNFLRISNSNLSNLTLDGTYQEEFFQIDLCTPNLTFLKLSGHIDKPIIGSPNLSLLEELNIESRTSYDNTELLIISWLQGIRNVKLMTVSLSALDIILQDLSKPLSAGLQPPRFHQLKSLMVKKIPYKNLSDDRLRRSLKYLLQNSPLAILDFDYDE
ncbi:F-box/LRR-repeat protein 13 [Vigna radiata var. radiata]|uniref:F-box/LRR-repeat protein 13 n=1 Tax=Vigna radiata var. radiata TaxID=3916 RepID=A0A1S3UPC2_VIGRR|nr:F-box/LRR-repeat protein 13 [Vigna radiata var. radiata]XP_022639655.1 F-box/LRR-repeat protein 13 [Vigna radiata var. radiata]XP_022639680.1 F-box/LRR-repeat protein 13 [Vigna radiata var. radiata]